MDLGSRKSVVILRLFKENASNTRNYIGLLTTLAAEKK